MAMDRVDGIAFTGCLLLMAASTVLQRVLIGAAFGGFLCSLAVWRLYDGQPWEALGWLAWVGTAVLVVLAPGGALFLIGVFGTGVAGIGLLVGGRLDLLPDIWRVEETAAS